MAPKSVAKRHSPPSVQELVPQPTLLPDEDSATFERLRDA
jgi:hypothetical protein